MKIFVVILSIISLCGCQHKVQDFFSPVKSFEQAFADTLGKKDLLFVVVNRQCMACSILEQTIENSPELKRRLLDEYDCISYPADMIGYELLPQLLYNYEFPQIIIVSRTGDVKALIRGAKTAKEFQSLLDQVKNNELVYNLNNHFFISDSAYVKLVSLTMKGLLAYYKNEYSMAEDLIRKSTDEYPYLYNLYLGAKIFQMNKDSLNADIFARKALQINNEFDDFLYRNLKDELIYITGKNSPFASSVKTIAFKEQSHDCGNVSQNVILQFAFEFKNIDTLPILIGNVQKSCNCMEVIWDKHPILPGENGYIYVNYDTSNLGMFTKILFVNITNKNELIPLYIRGAII